MMQRRACLGILGTLISGSLAIVLCSSCTVGPNYQRPREKVPATWSAVPEKGVTTNPVDVTRWWTLFQDPELDALIQRAVLSNKDLRTAEARVREARALRGVVAADLFPMIGVAADYARIRRSENQTPSAGGAVTVPGGVPGDGDGGGGSGGAEFGGISPEQNLFQIGFDASWEIDVFGGIRRSVEAAEADIGAALEDRRDILVTLLSEVARNYLQVRGTQRRIQIAYDNIQSQSDTLELTRARFEAGLSSDLEVAQAETLLSRTESEVPSLETQLKQAIHRLGVLLGQEPEALLQQLSEPGPIPPVPPEVPVGLPSDLIRRRPDVRRAERQLAAATARIGVAVADLFPRFSLTGSLGQQSASISDIAKFGSTAWSVGPTISWPIFQGGRICANIQVQNARQEQALLTYEQTLLIALEDVENALVAYAREKETRRYLDQSVQASRRAVDISKELYSQGLVDFLNVLESQRALFTSEDLLIQSEQRVSANLVALFKALGGGWETSPR